MAKHIVLFIHGLSKGGAERVMVNIAGNLLEAGVQVTLVTQYQEENEYPLPEGIARYYSEITPEEMGNGRLHNFLARYGKLRRLLKQLNPDLVLSFLGKNNLMAIGATLFTGIPVVVSVRGEPGSEYPGRLLKGLARFMFRFAKGIVFQTKQARDFFPKSVQDKSVILRNPLNEAFVRDAFQGERDGRVVAVGRLVDNKNHRMMLQAYAPIAKEFPHTSLVFYGEGPCREALLQQAEDLGIAKQVKLPGAVENVAEQIATASAFLLASYHEGMPNSLIEAMCLGIPSISTDCPCGGPAELIEHGQNGFLVPVDGALEMEECLRSIFTQKQRAKQIGEQATKLLELYHPEVVQKQWREYLLSNCRK